MPESQENFRKDISNELKLVLEMTARVDERVKQVIEKQSDMTTRLNSFIDSHNALASRVTVLEASHNGNGIGVLRNKYEMLFEKVTALEHETSEKDIEEMQDTLQECHGKVETLQDDHDKLDLRIQRVEDDHSSAWAKGKFVFDLLVKAGWAIFVGYLLYKLGLSSPHTPS